MNGGARKFTRQMLGGRVGRRNSRGRKKYGHV